MSEHKQYLPNMIKYSEQEKVALWKIAVNLGLIYTKKRERERGGGAGGDSNEPYWEDL